MTPSERLRALISAEMERLRVGVRRYEKDRDLRPWTLRGLMDSSRRQVPSVDRAAEICNALGLEFYIGPPRGDQSVNTPEYSQIAGAGSGSMAVRGTPSPPLPPDLERHTQGLVRAVAAAGGDPVPPDVRATMREQTSRPGRPWTTFMASNADLALIPVALNVTFDAESGKVVWDLRVRKMVVVAKHELSSWAVPEQLIGVRVAAGDSMAPTVYGGDTVAIDRRRQKKLLQDQLFALWSDEGVVVNRLQRARDQWQVVSDNSDYGSRPLNDKDLILGQVAWVDLPPPPLPPELVPPRSGPGFLESSRRELEERQGG